MTAPDAREWYALDPDKPAVREFDAALEQFAAAHPDVICGRFTLLGIDRGDPWLCIDGWLAAPDDQGPEPTDADIPVGFV